MVKIINLLVFAAVLIGLYKALQIMSEERHAAVGDGTLDHDEAYAVLGLQSGASRDDIVAAHIRLMKKCHPDSQGSEWLAKKVNAAKDLLLGR